MPKTNERGALQALDILLILLMTFLLIAVPLLIAL
jgi:hypothetical protein